MGDEARGGSGNFRATTMDAEQAYNAPNTRARCEFSMSFN